MCIIAIKFKGSDFFPAKNVKACCDNNPDGFAMAWNQNDKLKIFRTMDKEEFIAKYIATVKNLDPAVTGMVIHARIVTHGSKRVENCHLWREGQMAFAHNGMLSGIPARDDMTDSETFFRDYFLPASKKLGWDYAVKLARAVIGSSKFVWINNKGDILPMGEYCKDEFEGLKGKLYFSNRNYIPRNDYFAKGAFISGTAPRAFGRPAIENAPYASGRKKGAKKDATNETGGLFPNYSVNVYGHNNR